MNALTHVVDGGSGATLSPKAEAVLRFIMSSPNRIHAKDDIAAAVGATSGGRCIDTYIAEARKALGALRDSIVVSHGKGAYGWIGAPVELVPAVKSCAKAHRNDPMARYAVITREEVAKRLGITSTEVANLERKALSKLRKQSELHDAWKAMLSESGSFGRTHFEPFYECWLLSVQASFQNFRTASEVIT